MTVDQAVDILRKAGYSGTAIDYLVQTDKAIEEAQWVQEHTGKSRE